MDMNKCIYCGKPLDSSGKCECWKSLNGEVDNVSENQEYLNTISELLKDIPNENSFNFNYGCPRCGGYFNTPAIQIEPEIIIYKCPFCGVEMEGFQKYEVE